MDKQRLEYIREQFEEKIGTWECEASTKMGRELLQHIREQAREIERLQRENRLLKQMIEE